MLLMNIQKNAYVSSSADPFCPLPRVRNASVCTEASADTPSPSLCTYFIDDLLSKEMVAENKAKIVETSIGKISGF